MSENPYFSAVPPEPPLAKRPRLVSRWRVILLVLVASVVVAGWLLDFVRIGHEPARRTICSHNLRQISLALQQYAAEFGSLPPAHTVDDAGRPLHSWRTLILPYLDCEDLYRSIDLSKPWDDPANAAACAVRLPFYECPSVNVMPGQTIYQAIVHAEGCFPPSGARRWDAIKDDPGQTLLVVEVEQTQAVPWMSPHDTNERVIQKLHAGQNLIHGSDRSYHLAATVDGRIVVLERQLAEAELQALISVAAGDDDRLQRFR